MPGKAYGAVRSHPRGNGIGKVNFHLRYQSSLHGFAVGEAGSLGGRGGSGP